MPSHSDVDMTGHASSNGDPLLERLERLAARQGRPPAASTLPPPPPGSAEWTHAAPPPAAKAVARTRRRHPARSARIGALMASCATTGGLVYLLAGTGAPQAGAPVPGLAAPIATTATATTTVSTTSASAIDTTIATTTVPAGTGQVVGFDGDIVDTKFGPLQVQAQVQNGSLVAVAVVQYPDEDGKSVRINQRALPELQSEALSAQSADVDTISGATYTSAAYVTSLQSAIDEARAARAITA